MNLLTQIIARTKSAADVMADVVHQRLFNASFAGDGLVSYGKSVSFLEKDGFADIVRRQSRGKHQNEGRAWRLHTLAWAARRALSLKGDFVECGVFEGFFSAVVCEFLSFEKVDRTFWLYDTFEGFSTKYTTAKDFGHGQLFLDVAQQDYRRPRLFEAVKDRFASYPNVKVIQGILPDALDGGCPEQIAYLHVDLNSPRAEFLTMERLYPKVTAGGVIVFDDYGWKNFRKQEEAISAFFQKTGEMILELPTGQAMVIKQGA